MSIEPEVPYEIDDYEDTWRDPSILPDNDTVRLVTTQIKSQVTNNQSPEYEKTPEGEPDDYWVLPSINAQNEILGRRRQKLDEIRRRTNAYLDFNERKNQIDIWGNREAIDMAKHYFTTMADQLEQRQEMSRRKTRKWEKPERELTDRERRRLERKQAQIAEDKSYQGEPPAPQPYTAVFIIPDQTLPVPKLLGEKESYLNNLRTDYKCYMWYSPDTNVIMATGQKEDDVCKATERIRNWYLKCSRQPIPQTLRLIQPPKAELGVRFRKLPQEFVTYVYTNKQQEEFMLDKQRLIEAVVTGKPASLIDLDDNYVDASSELGRLGDKDAGMACLRTELTDIQKGNIEKVHSTLETGLESLRLFDWEIRMKIRFGQICLVDYPNITKLISVEKLANKYFPKSQFNSVLAPCIAKTRAQANPLFEYLSQHCEEFADSPRTSYVIHAMQNPTTTPVPTSRRDPIPSRVNPWKTVLTISFSSDGRIGLWKCLTGCTDLVRINCTVLEGSYSWETKLEYGRRMPTDIDTPQGNFAHKLRLGPEKRLILVSVPDYQPQTVVQKTKWVYGRGDYIIEVTEDELWDVEHIENRKSNLPLDLSQHAPHRTIYKVAMYKESWPDRFAENVTLGIGEAPSWSTVDFLATEDENASVIQNVANEFADILSRELPLYWEKRSILD